MVKRWTQTIIRARLAVVLGWILITAAGAFASTHIGGHLTASLETPGSQSAQADALLGAHFGENNQGTFTVLYKFKTSTPTQIEEYQLAIVQAAQVIPGSEIAQQKTVGGTLFASITTSLSLLNAAAYTDALRHALLTRGLSGALVTGPPAINRDVSPVLAHDLSRSQLVAILMALLLLILILGVSLAVLIPLMFATASVSLALLLVYVLSQKMVMVLYIPNIVELIGLGLAIDYSLLMVHRFRREISENPDIDTDNAVQSMMATAGRTVVISGSVVSLALSTLLLVPVPFVRSLGAAGLIVPMTSVMAAITLIPAILSILGQNTVTTFGFRGIIGRADVMNGAWAKIARFVVAKPKPVFITSLLTLAIMASFVFALAITPSSPTAIPANLESSKALTMVINRAGSGVITPHELVIDLGKENLANTLSINSARLDLAKRLLKNPEIFIVATEDRPPFIDATGRYLRLFIIGRHGLGLSQSNQLVQTLRTINLAQSGFSGSAKLYLGGAPAQGVDLIRAILNSLPWIVLLLFLLTFLLLARALRSVILPIKAILLDLISVAVAFSALVVVFHFGFGTTFLHTYRLDQIEAWVLIFLFAILFGLSMDYEIFLVSRMREARDRGASNSNSIIEGIAHTGGVVSAAAIIFVCAISGFVTGHFAGLQQLGIGLGVGVLIDATIIRGLLLPSAMILLGRWNWWLPATFAHLLHTKASPLDQPEVRL